MANIVDLKEYIYKLAGQKPYEEKNSESIPLDKMTVEQMIEDYNLFLKVYKNYIKALEQEEPTKTAILKIMSCQSEIEALENIKALTNGLSILGKKIINTGHKFTKEEAGEGIHTDQKKTG